MASPRRKKDAPGPGDVRGKPSNTTDRRTLDHFGLSHPGNDPRPLRYPNTERVFSALIIAQIQGRALYDALEASIRHAAKSPIREEFGDLDYLEPPEFEHDPETRAVVEQRREANPRHFKETIRIYDRYHRALHALWNDIETAKDATDNAQDELDAGGGTPLDLPTVGIRRALDRLRCAVQPPILVGPYPTMNTAEHLRGLAEAISVVHDWTEKLRPAAGQRVSGTRRLNGHHAKPPNASGLPPRPTDAPVRLVVIAEAAKVLNVRGDLVLKKLRNRDLSVHGAKGSYMAELDDIKICYPNRVRRLTTWADEHFPAESDPL